MIQRTDTPVQFQPPIEITIPSPIGDIRLLIESAKREITHCFRSQKARQGHFIRTYLTITGLIILEKTDGGDNIFISETINFPQGTLIDASGETSPATLRQAITSHIDEPRNRKLTRVLTQERTSIVLLCGVPIAEILGNTLKKHTSKRP